MSTTKVSKMSEKENVNVASNDKLTKREFGLIFVESCMSNYNGDPDEDNKPRTLSDGTGLISPVCFKHRIREMIEDHKSPIWEHVKKLLDLDEEHYHIWESPVKGYDVATPLDAKEFWSKLVKESGKEALLKRFWDQRVFGTTALEENKNKGKKKSQEEGEQDQHMKFIRTGCVAVSPLTSLAPIEIVSKTISKGNPLEDKLIEDAQGTLAPFSFKVGRHGVFSGFYVINPSKAHYTGTTKKDIELFKTLIKDALSVSISALRSGVRAVQIINAEHDSPLCSFNESAFLEFCRPEIIDKDVLENGSTSLSQYKFKTLEQIQEKFPNVKVTMLLDFVN